MADAQGVEDAGKRDALAALEAIEKVVARALLPAVQSHQLLFGEGVEVAQAAYQAEVVELVYGGVSRQDVHGVAAGKVHESRLDLGGTAGAVGTVVLGFVLVAYQRGAAVGTEGGEVGFCCIRRALAELHAGDLGDYLAPFLYIYPVADAHVQQVHLVFVVQRGALDDGARQGHGV